jgi:hypothetical protein
VGRKSLSQHEVKDFAKVHGTCPILPYIITCALGVLSLDHYSVFELSTHDSSSGHMVIQYGARAAYYSGA